MPLSVAFCDFRGDAFQSADYHSALVLAPATQSSCAPWGMIKYATGVGGCGHRWQLAELSEPVALYPMGRKLKPHRRFSQEQIRKVADYIRANLDEQLTLVDLACLVDLSPRQFFRIFSITFGTTPHRYIVNERVALAKELIVRGQLLVEIASVLGFASQSSLQRRFS
jgi:AraC-like DNA-binding protein